MLAALLVAAAAPARAHAAQGRSPAPKPTPRAFFGLGPATKGKIDGRSYFNWSATPAGHLSDQVAVVNFGTKPVTVRIFVTNAVNGTQGTTGFAPRGQAKGGPFDWITVRFPHNSPVLHLAPRSKVLLPITVLIPKNAQPGDHEGAIIAALTSTIQVRHRAKLHLVQQVAVRIITRVSCPTATPNCLRPQISVLDLKVSHTDSLNPFSSGSATLSFEVKNTGNELLGGKITASVNGLFGSSETSKKAITLPPLLPGGTYRGRLGVDGVYPEFLMTAKVQVVPLAVTGQYDVGLRIFSAQVSYVSIPWIPLIIFLLLVAFVVYRWLRRRPPAALVRWLGRRGRTGSTATEPSPEPAGSVGQ